MAKPDTVRDEPETQAAGTAAKDDPASQAGGAAPDKPTDLGGASWLAAGRRTIKEFKDDFLQDRAAALTYYGVLSIFRGSWCWYPCLGCSASRGPSH